MISEKARSMLNELADFLDRLPAQRFDYSKWVGSSWAGASDLSCGTTACAAGWATTLPSFKEAGLKLESYSYFDNGGIVTHGDEVGTVAVADALGITHNDAVFLFTPSAFHESSRALAW